MTIRVLHCIARMNAGGTATLLDGLMSEMDPSIEQLLVYGRCEGDEIDFLKGRDTQYNTIYLDSLARSIHPLRDLKSFFALKRIVRKFRPDIIHSHTFKAGVIARAAALTMWHRPKIVHTFHGHLLTGYFSPTITRIISLLERFFARFSDVLLTVGPQVTSDLLKAGIGKSLQYRLILPGVAVPKGVSKADARNALELKQDVFTIGFVGRLTQIKRVDRFLDCLSLLSIPYQAFIAGEGEEADSAKKQVADGNLSVTFLGWRDDIDNLFSAADVIVLSSDNEGFGLVLGEAQLRGTPVVATNVGSVRAALIDGKSGFLVNPDAPSIATAVNAIASLSAEQYQVMSDAAKEFAHEAFSMARFARQHQELYMEII